MTVQELIEILKEKDQGSLVVMEGWGEEAHMEATVDHAKTAITVWHDWAGKIVVLSTKANTL